MKGKTNRRSPEIIVRDSKPVAVILDIDDYQQILDRLDDAEDLKVLREMKRRPLRFKKLDDFLKEYTPGV